jgi:hypothetical protein
VSVLIKLRSGEEIELESDRVITADELDAILGKAEDPLVKALVSEIRRLSSILASQPAHQVNVSPTPISVAAPIVSLSPVLPNAPREWDIEITERDVMGKTKRMKLKAT